MRCLLSIAPLLLTFGLVTTAVSKHPQSEHKSRTSDKDLSNEDHMLHGEHNPKYDQDALFGNSAEEFRGLSDDDKESRLKTLFFQMDANHDGYVSAEELREWMNGNALDQWNEYGLKTTDSLTWDFYKQRVTEIDGDYEDKDEETQKKYLERDRRRWDVADANGDGVLSFTESAAFFNAETHPGMQDIVVEETLNELDRDHDGFISPQEYIEDLWVPSNPSDEEPDWIKSERNIFDAERDKNHDGKLDKEEVKAWLFAAGGDHVESEVSHLLSNCDIDRDAKLSEQELIGCHDTLVGSAVTNYGELLTEHDEL